MTRWTVHFIWAGLLVSIVALSRAETSTNSAPLGSAKAKPEFPAQMKVGVVDIKFIFMHYKLFNEKMAAIKTKVETAEAKISNQQEEIKKLTDQSKNESTPADERAELDKKVVERQSLLQAECAIQKQEFQRLETAVYADCMAAVDRHIAEYARKHGVHIVMRVTVDPPNQNDLNEIRGALSKNVLYFDSNLDVTPWIVKALNEE
jgi:Skp family chaperone for outer membrane proteins